MPRHVIVDGSNIATEGRQLPSLQQLNEAVTAFMQEFPDDVITVVVDATFGHRIDASEVADFDEAVAHNELVAPPAGAIGRGDSFILSIANKTQGSILTNDSYQEFHGEYPWVFDEGRLIGGKPVPYVGWVFVLRTPVRGPVSRKSVKAGRSVNKNTGRAPRASKEASLPMPVPKAPPPGVAVAKPKEPEQRRGRQPRQPAPAVPAPVAVSDAPVTDETASRPAPPRDAHVNEVMSFINFVQHHPVGSSVNAVVDSYSSHGAYVTVGDVRGYVPLRLMCDPPARSARELGKVGDAITLVVHSFTPARRSIDMAVPAAALKAGVQPASVPVEPAAVEAAAIAEVSPDGASRRGRAPAKPSRRTRKDAAAAEVPAAERVEPIAPVEPVEPVLFDPIVTAEEAAPPVPASRPKRTRKAAAPVAAPIEPAPVAEPAPPTKPAKRASSAAKPAAKPATVERAAKKAAAPSSPARKAGPATVETATQAPAEAAPAKRSSSKRSPARKTPAVNDAVLTAMPAAAPAAPVVEPAPSKRGAAKKQAPAKAAPAAKKAPAKKATAKAAAPPATSRKRTAKAAPVAD